MGREVGRRIHDQRRCAVVADGKVIVSGNRPNGFIQAFDAVTGK